MPCVVINALKKKKSHGKGVKKKKSKQTNPGRCSRAPLLPK